MLYFLPERIKNGLDKLDLNFISEIRLRKNHPIIIIYKFKYYYLTEKGLSKNNNDGIVCYDYELSSIINVVCENSIYAFNDRIKEGFLTTIHGVRIGIAGHCVFDKGNILTINNFTSLNVRIPHDVINCSKQIYNKIFKNQIYNLLIISPPGQGKTTLIKDLALKLGKKRLNVLIIDERGEMASVSSEFIDRIENCNKEYAFNYGLRSMSPNVIIVDELSNSEDWKFALTAINSGVKLIATSHGDSIYSVSKKPYYIKNLFDRYVCLKTTGIAGQIDKIYDGDFNLI